MSIRRTGLLVFAIVVLAPGAASATGHNADLSGGASGASGSSFWGFHEMFAKTVPIRNHGRVLSFVGDLSWYKGSENGIDQTVLGWMGGARWTFGLGTVRTPMKGVTGHVMLSPHALVGAFYTNGKDGVLAGAVGGSVDVLIGTHGSSEPGWGVRLSSDYVARHGPTPNLVRYSLEGVYRFAHKN